MSPKILIIIDESQKDSGQVRRLRERETDPHIAGQAGVRLGDTRKQLVVTQGKQEIVQTATEIATAARVHYDPYIRMGSGRKPADGEGMASSVAGTGEEERGISTNTRSCPKTIKTPWSYSRHVCWAKRRV